MNVFLHSYLKTPNLFLKLLKSNNWRVSSCFSLCCFSLAVSQPAVFFYTWWPPASLHVPKHLKTVSVCVYPPALHFFVIIITTRHFITYICKVKWRSHSVDISNVLQYFIILNFNIFFGGNIFAYILFHTHYFSTIERMQLLLNSDTSIKFSNIVCMKIHVCSYFYLGICFSAWRKLW